MRTVFVVCVSLWALFPALSQSGSCDTEYFCEVVDPNGDCVQCYDLGLGTCWSFTSLTITTPSHTYNELSAMVTAGASALTFQSWSNNDCSGNPDYSGGLSDSCGVCYEINPTVHIVMEGTSVPYHGLGNSNELSRRLHTPLKAVPRGRMHEFEIGHPNAIDSGVEANANATATATVRV